MGNCTASKLVIGEEDAIDLCKERKRLLKAAVDRRYILADAHSSYALSLRSVAAAINLFIARYNSSLSPSIPTPPPPLLLQQTPTQPKTKSLTACPSSSSSSSMTSTNLTSSSSPSATNVQEIRGGYFYSGLPTTPISPINDFGWDFFNPFDGVRAVEEAAMLANLCRSSDEDLRVVREEEGIPELEEAEEEEEEREAKKTEICNVGERKEVEKGETERGLTVTEKTGVERELLDALRDVEDQFIRAFDCGKEVSKMLEVYSNSRVDDHLQSFHLDEVKENSSRLIQAITWHRSPSSQSSSRRSYSASSSKDTLSIESKSDLFDDCGGMESGSHSQTLGRLYAWEKKLYEEVKAADYTRQLYKKKCIELSNMEDAKGADSRSLDKLRSAVSDSYTRIWVSLRSIETISMRIQKVRDDELQPQLIELVQGFLTTWKIMLESHETQKQIMLEVKSFSCPSYGKFCTDSQRQVTVRLEAELRNWRAGFMSYVAAQRSYVEALDGWVSKFFIPDIEYYARYKSSIPSYNRLEAPPLVIICHDWSSAAKKLPDKSVSFAMKGFIKATRVLWVKQGDEQQQKRKVDSLAKELDRKVLAFKKLENKVLESKLCDIKPEPDVRDRVEYLAERKDLIEDFRKKLDMEKAKHQECMKETQRVMLDGFRTGLTGLFESLAMFSKDCVKLHSELLMHNERGKMQNEIEGKGKKPCIEDSHVEVGSR